MTAIRTDVTDHHLIAQFKEGSMEAMETIVDRYENQIFNFGLKMCGQLQDAEDITQDTFLNAFKYLKTFREETKLKNWLFKLAATACIRKRRKKKCEPEHELSLETSFANKDGTSGTYDIPDWSDEPSNNVLLAEMKSVIDHSIKALPHKYRLVFNLRDIEGFSTKETAEILGISIESVKTRLHRARTALREKISQAYREGKNA
ncbi:MAG: sigma-70 family RNA polymerase sigma factor [Deltaproteobacteria bacterium]|nr:sigma-70 family RNA polymerase sigma factor [Deltaproteobacteria bacterium]